jgi:GcrA cell cycle regulator
VAVGSVWSDGKVAELRRLWVDEKLSGSQIALRLGLKDRNAVMGKIHRLGITRKLGANGEIDVTDAAGAKPVADALAPADRIPEASPAPVEVAPLPPPETASEPEAPSTSAVSPDDASEKPKDSFSDHPIMQLKENSCRWPIGDPQVTGFRFCCKAKAGTLPYCSEHAAISYLAPENRTRRPSTPKAA